MLTQRCGVGLLTIVGSVTLASPAVAQPGRWAFKNRSYYEALLSEPRAARMRLIVPAWSDGFEFSQKPGRRQTWEITLGREFPLVGWQSTPLASGGGDGRFLGAGQWGFGVWAPVSFHMIEGFKDDSNPIINTDYRFGVMTKAEYSFTDDPRSPRATSAAGHAVAFRFTPFAHESTHLGDEFTIQAADVHGDAFERINVSYEYWEYGVSYKSLFGCLSALRSPSPGQTVCHRLTVRHGGINLWGDDGYYSDHLLGEPRGAGTITPSKENYEPSFGIEYRAPHMEGLPRQRGFLISLDARYRTVYDYHKAGGPDASEERQWSFGLVLGLTQPYGADDVPLDYFLYVYHGVNPHGQFRSQKDYTAFGVGWIFGG